MYDKIFIYFLSSVTKVTSVWWKIYLFLIFCCQGYQCMTKDTSPVACLSGYYNEMTSPTGQACKICPGGYSCPTTSAAVACAAGKTIPSFRYTDNSVHLHECSTSECLIYWCLTRALKILLPWQVIFDPGGVKIL